MTAGVAFHLTLVAITMQLARRLGCWVVGGTFLNQPQHGCAEKQARVSSNVMMRDMDLLSQDGLDTRRLEVVADGLPLHHEAQLAIDTTMVSPMRRNGAPRPRSTTVDGASLETVRARKKRRHPELSATSTARRLWCRPGSSLHLAGPGKVRDSA